jgi:peptide chain release factor subunit 1
VRERAVVDVTPYTRPLLAVLDEARRYCVVVVDREHAWLFGFYMGELRGMRRLRGRVLRKPDYAGWHGLDEHRVRNRAGEMARRHFRATVAAVDKFMAETGTELLVVGGHEETVAQFLPLLPQPLQSRLAGTFAIDPRTMTPGRLREQTEAIIDRYEREEETRLVNEALERVAAGGLGASGLEWCLVAVNEQAVQLLLVNDDDQAPGKACDNCGWLGLTGDECPVCGRRTRATPDVIDEMAEAVVGASGRVEHVYAETDLAREHVAALLRFPLPKLVATG